jgi:hypothetical protein
MNFLIAAIGLVLVTLAPTAVGQTISPAATFSCTFSNSPTDCGFYLQAAASSRATLAGIGRDGATALDLTTEPGDSNLFGSGTAERADLELPPSSSYCNQGQEEWWAESVYLPDSYVVPPSGATWNWGIISDFHHTGPTGQPNFQIVSLPTGLELWGAGGATIVNGPNDPGFFRAAIGPVTKNAWYDFKFHIKWSSGADGFLQAWVNGQQVLNHSGATLYSGQSCYFKLANYHTALGVPVSVIHDRIVRGPTDASVSFVGSAPSPPKGLTVASDFNGDGKSDILWRNDLTGQDLLWLMNAAAVVNSTALALVSDLNWGIAGVGDFNGDGKADILWHNRSTGQNQIWFMNGGSLVSAANLTTLATDWVVAGVGDFSGNGTADILWRSTSTGQNQVWLMNGATVATTTTLQTVSDPNWKVVGVGDFDGDGTADVLWRNQSSGQNAVFLMSAGTVRQAAYITTVADPSWSIVGVGDFDGDGHADILWRNSSSGENAIFFMNGATVASTVYTTTLADPNWVVAAIGDYDGDGRADILWRNKLLGTNQIYFMNGATVTTTADLSTLQAAGWSVLGH